jgi:N-acetylmuramoyl-L-alanine amidase
MDNKNYSNIIVCLDNGHGEETPGKRSPYSANGVPPELPFREYQYCREIVEQLKNELVELGFEVFVVTPETWDVYLSQRAKRVNQVVAEAKKEGKHTLMISVHNNAAGKGDVWKAAYGWSAWTTKGQNNSDKLAGSLYKAAEEVLTPLNQKIRRDSSDGDPDYEENFTIIYKSNCPAVLTENMFQDCIKEVEFLLSEEGKNAIVEIHKRGIIDFCEKMEWC